MKTSRSMTYVPALLVAGSLLVGCGRQEAEVHEEEAPSGAFFNAGKGVSLTEETRKILGVEVVEVTEQKLPEQVRFGVQVYGEKHHPALDKEDHSGCDVRGSGVLSPAMAASVQVGLPVQIHTQSNEIFQGTVIALPKPLAMDETEIIVGISNAAAALKPGEFLSGVVTLPRTGAAIVIPRSALLRAVDGTFVYTVNGDAYFRTAVKVGAESEDRVEITDGLFAGDAVVTKAMETLWLIELRATKGGAGCTH